MPNIDPVHLKAVFGMEPATAVQYLSQKGYRITWNWQDQLNEAHARAFTVAKAVRLDVLQDIRSGLADALKTGKTVEQFKDELTPLLQAKGWWGKQVVVDSQGNAEQIQLGSARRLKTIYQTNLQSAYMAGRYQQMEATKAALPYWMYVAVLDSRTRPSHRAMNGQVFAADDPVWDAMYPPNGFNCRCRVRALSDKMVQREGRKVSKSDGHMVKVSKQAGLDKRTGELHQIDVRGIRLKGIEGKDFVFSPDVGFDYNPGKAAFKPFMPPPDDNLPPTFLPGQHLPKMVPPTPLPEKAILPTGLPHEDYIKAFLSEFNASLEQPSVFKDVAEERLLISADLFRDGKGQWKVTKNGRERYLAALAKTIKSPDEIWMRWEESRSQPGKWLLKRRYLKAWLTDQDIFGIGVFEFGEDGWSGSTVFHTDATTAEARVAYIEKQRDGTLMYRRK
ncbi:minor capsid protein [Leeia sp. TBRC 13508]|uniref:Minor capsid protein n=1 Tax=Leeia speluncae TaxID=2884804 RepID=A0ABS8D2V6_9NEIS|nr:phage minor head protein [Leeia speluncae]MCB6182323.1 minor capsid protein [Leeia speluncae]